MSKTIKELKEEMSKLEKQLEETTNVEFLRSLTDEEFRNVLSKEHKRMDIKKQILERERK